MLGHGFSARRRHLKCIPAKVLCCVSVRSAPLLERCRAAARGRGASRPGRPASVAAGTSVPAEDDRPRKTATDIATATPVRAMTFAGGARPRRAPRRAQARTRPVISALRTDGRQYFSRLVTLRDNSARQTRASSRRPSSRDVGTYGSAPAPAVLGPSDSPAPVAHSSEAEHVRGALAAGSPRGDPLGRTSSSHRISRAGLRDARIALGGGQRDGEHRRQLLRDGVASGHVLRQRCAVRVRGRHTSRSPRGSERNTGSNLAARAASRAPPQGVLSSSRVAPHTST